MKRTAVWTALLLSLSMVWVTAAAAETRYVSDELIVTVRQSTQPGAEVLTTVRSDEPVEVLEEAEKHLKIRTQDGTVGYIQAQYITTETPRPIIIERLQRERDRLQERIEQLQATRDPEAEEPARLREENARLEQALSETRTELEATREKYETLARSSEEVVDIIAERDRLQQSNDELTAELNRIEEESELLLRSGMIKWFLAGGGVLLVGWILGKVSRKKRRF